MEVEILNIKKLFPEKKDFRKRFFDFIDKKGFYVVLILCIGIVGAVAVFVATRNMSSSEINYDTQKIIPDEIMNDTASSLSDKNTMQLSPTATPLPSGKKDSAAKPAVSTKPTVTNDKKQQPAPNNEQKSVPKSNKSSAAVNASSGKDNKFIMPVFGQVSLEYAEDKLVYSRTLEAWQTHKGLDIACEKGTAVKAAADGYVSEIKNDERLGYTVVIDHSNGLKTAYSNLASGIVVSPNQKVTVGDIIGCVGDTAVFESAEQSHLHFEVLKNNKNVNPSNYLPKNQ